MKKVFGLWMVLSLAFLGCSVESGLDQTEKVSGEGVAQAKNFTEPVAVRLISAESYERGHYGITTVERRFRIRVKNIAYAKKITIYHERLDGTWINLPATYVEAADNGYEIWGVSYSWANNGQGAYPLSDQFVVRYEVDGKVYWDNNDGKNYDMIRHSGPIFGNGVNLKLKTFYKYNQYNTGNTVFYGTVDVRNLGYHKKIKVVYTTDGWNTVKTAYAGFGNAYYPSYAAPIYAPTAYGTEPWSFSVDLGGQYASVEFAIAYEVNRQTYWDNNYGKNYRLAN